MKMMNPFYGELLDIISCGKVISFGSFIVVIFSIVLIKKLYLSREIKPNGRVVLITGFGHELAKRLDSKGFRVFASCLFPDGGGAKKLAKTCSNRLRTLALDVTQDESVEKAVKFVKENLGSSELWAVVNNAGILKGFTVETSTVEDFKEVFEVNFFGTVRVTKAFLPLLKKSKGRIVNVTSRGGEISLPFFTPYLSSKYAAVGFTDCLRHEIQMQGVSVVSIEPEFFSTPLLSPDTVNKNSKVLERAYTAGKDGFSETLKDLANAFLSSGCYNIDIVVDDMESAVALEHPHYTYKPCRNAFARFLLFCFEHMPRSFHILLVKIGLFIAYSESKMLKSMATKIISFIV